MGPEALNPSGQITYRYKFAPTTYQPIIRQSRDTGEREMVLARWGMVPFFTEDMKDVKRLSTINARAETCSLDRYLA